MLLPPAPADPAAAPAADRRGRSTVTGHAWAPFISPMGEPFRARSATDDTLADWFSQADRNRDGVLTADEMVGRCRPLLRAARHRSEMARSIPTSSPITNRRSRPTFRSCRERGVRPASRRSEASDDRPERSPAHARAMASEWRKPSSAIGGGLQGAARYGLLNMPEPVAAADTDFDRGISRAEFSAGRRARFAAARQRSIGRLTLAQLEACGPPRSPMAARRKRETTPPTPRRQRRFRRRASAPSSCRARAESARSRTSCLRSG